MQPLRDLLLIELDEIPETTTSGIFMKKAWETPMNIATVLEVGPDTKTKKGTRVVINPYATLETTEKRTKFIREKDVLSHVK